MSRRTATEACWQGRAVNTERTPRVAAARKLLRRGGREAAGRFLVEGTRAVTEALAAPHAVVHEVFATAAAAAHHADLLAGAAAAGVAVTEVTERAAAGLSETVTPQGVVAVCDLLDVALADALAGAPRLVAVLVGVADPGNAGTVVRVADAAGADAVLFAGESVDPHIGKCVRASAGSLFHLPVARQRDLATVLVACRVAGLGLLAADGRGEVDLDAADEGGRLDGPTAWLFGSESHGLPREAGEAAAARVRVPLYGRAESLNLATAAAVCLYASARAQRRATAVRPPYPIA